uniref:DNA-directed RNA polymerase subunit alpha n=1 Tax=Sciadococcus taiwanensis TaxID=3028030 RepID=A0A9Y1I2A4_9RHOD|nr:RNA polymerase alpha subunit [Sciadococcus taiwanensis]
MTHFQIECLESRIDGPRDLYSKFEIAPLKQGQGITLGNALRRSLLADLEGVSIVAVRIAGVSHEFSTISGVREDVLEILLNLKEIVFTSEITESQIGRLRVQGPAIITAAQLELPPEIHLVDPQQYIATICNTNIIEMEFKIEKGTGYRLIEKNSSSLSVDYLQVDAVFMPIKKVNYYVQENKLENEDFQDKLILEVYTNGSITPQNAIIKGAEILTDLFNPLRALNLTLETHRNRENNSKIGQILIEELQLSVRAYNCLKRAQINLVADLLDYSQEDLLEIKNFGQKSAEEVIEALNEKLGIELPKEKTNQV